jgi:TolB-like protein
MGRTAAALLALLLTGCESAPTPVATAPAPTIAAEPPLYAALPFRNLTSQDDAPALLLSRLESLLAARGARFAPAGEVERSLRRNRVRYTDSVSVDAAQRIAADTGAHWLLIGSVLAWESQPDPRITTLLRVVDVRDGRRATSRLVTLTGTDFEGLLGLGAITDVEELADEVAIRLTDVFGVDGAPLFPRADREGLVDEMPYDVFTRFIAADFDLSAVERVAVLPLGNRADRPDAGLLFADLLAHQWFTSIGMDVVERSELMSLLVRKELRSIQQLDLEMLRSVGDTLGARYVISGSIDRLGAEVWVGGVPQIEVEAVVWVLDVHSGNVVAAAGLRRRSDHYHRGLGLGIVRDPVKLADRTAHELVAVVGG